MIQSLIRGSNICISHIDLDLYVTQETNDEQQSRIEEILVRNKIHVGDLVVLYNNYLQENSEHPLPGTIGYACSINLSHIPRYGNLKQEYTNPQDYFKQLCENSKMSVQKSVRQ